MMDRRRLLRLLPAGLAWSISASWAPLVAARPRRQSAALLVPLTGSSASLGRSMQRAAAMAQPTDARDAALMVLDTGGTASGAAAVAADALRRGAAFILGPLFAGEVRSVTAAVAGRVPVLAFSNDETLGDGGAFLLGITATQAVAGVLGYARRRGVRSVAMLGGASPWAAQAAAAALRQQGEIGLVVRTVATADAAALRRTNGGELPDALLVAEGGAAFAAAARAIAGSGVQLLGTLEAIEPGQPIGPDIQGAWIAAPDPAAVGDFAQDFEQRNGGAPGLIAALAYDGAGIVRSLLAAARLDRAGLLQTASFPGVAGAVHFREDGSATRQLAILVADASGFSPVPA